AYHDTIERQLAPGGELVHVAGHASKTAEMACRIAGVLALVDDLDAPEVDRETMASGIAIAQYHLAEVRHIITEADISEKIRQAEQLR
ncbi:DUF3987 domain-containing protein, partial [Paralimibaculum aggregatum]|uniref:DUF3987 domain-containing protein n=1 Tax=Paralimibaculum aggregatum TaxID=3036245 RepID=UPI0025520FFC